MDLDVVGSSPITRPIHFKDLEGKSGQQAALICQWVTSWVTERAWLGCAGNRSDAWVTGERRALAYKKRVHRSHPKGGVVCDHKETDAIYERTTEDDAVTCLKCESILSGKFGGRPFKLPECE